MLEKMDDFFTARVDGYREELNIVLRIRKKCQSP